MSKQAVNCLKSGTTWMSFCCSSPWCLMQSHLHQVTGNHLSEGASPCSICIAVSAPSVTMRHHPHYGRKACHQALSGTVPDQFLHSTGHKLLSHLLTPGTLLTETWPHQFVTVSRDTKARPTSKLGSRHMIYLAIMASRNPVQQIK